jgi:DNA-binding HxlR family transcriptional regulator
MPKYCQSIDSRYHGYMSAATDVMTVSGRLADGDRKGYSEVCPIERALKTIGTRSALVILREAFWGARRFEDFAQRAGITEQIASARLKQLVDAGIMTKQPYKTPGQRVRYEYVLTGVGRQLFPVLVSLIEFGLLLQGDAKRLDLVHGEGCGAPVTTHVQCAEGHAVGLTQTEARIRPRKKR